MTQRMVAPELLAIQQYPGNVLMLEVEYLAAEDGWQRLDLAATAIKDWKGATDKLEVAVAALHDCCGQTAVHGDLRGPNIMVR